ncbi:transporter substrate-binding domain-containing protein [Bosea sp. (in: a-proteobacteria)]|uniref:transporter substrate-binding domain-containing protein n=1 Tax=Bosea sp. (in: a-proteobacteria) TaxID=1871050 RepID=UPI00262F1AEF|nr:transporter substrate-binding domain-containing protein [Bosea sp. (in: a-proteobacteria)]MCO5092927.1 transporter substrate-binding domain-containing protein [Bosea sp. (in: a-proteobacteria)]
MSRTNLIARFAVAALACLFMAAPASAQRLDEIIKRGKLLVGIDINSPPYGFQDEKQEAQGSEVETARMLAKDLGVELEIVPTTVANRVPYLTTNRVDAVMATFAITPERAKSVWFTTPYGTTGSIIIAPKGTTIRNYADLDGKKIATTRGSAAEIALGQNAPKGAQIVRLDDDAAASAALITGQVDSLITTPAIAQTLYKRFPDRGFEEKFSVLKFWYGAGVARGHTDLLQWLNTALMFNIQNGNISRINEKWMGVPLNNIPTL